MTDSEVRFSLLRRDNFICRLCGARPGNEGLVVHRIVPQSRRGSDDLENLITVCDPCGAASGDKVTIPSGLARDAEGWTIWKQFGPWNVELCESGMIVNYTPRHGYYWISQERVYEQDWESHIERKPAPMGALESLIGLAGALRFARQIILPPVRRKIK